MNAGISEAALLTRSEFRPLPYEVDFTGFLSNTVVPTWLERLRVQFMVEHFADLNIYAPQHLSVIARTQIEYLKPVRLTDSLGGLVRVARCLSASWTVEFSFRHLSTGEEHLRAAQVGVFLDHETMTPTRIPQFVRQRLATSCVH